MDERRVERRRLYARARWAVGVGLVVNVLLGVAKLVGGILGSSSALLADAVNSLGDVVTSSSVLFALFVARKPPDEEHPYGHTRAEAVAGSNLALLVVATALFVGWEAITRLGVPHPLPPWWTLWIAGVNVVVKEGLYHWKVRVARQTGSTAILAHAWDHRSDALCALAVLVGLGLVRWGGPELIAADEVAALIVVAAILHAGLSLFWRSAHELLDAQADEELRGRVRACALETADVRGIDDLRIRKSGLEHLVDIHVEVDGDLTVEEGHRVGHATKDRILRAFPAVRDVLVHVEPHEPPAAEEGPA